jgi:hypothetical protein
MPSKEELANTMKHREIKENLSQNMDYIESLTTWSKELFNKVNGVFASRPKAPQVK